MNLNYLIENINAIQVILFLAIILLVYYRIRKGKKKGELAAITLDKTQAGASLDVEIDEDSFVSKKVNREVGKEEGGEWSSERNEASISMPAPSPAPYIERRSASRPTFRIDFILIVILLVFAFLCYTTIAQYAQSKSLAGITDLGLLEILSIIGTVAGCIFVFVLGLVGVFWLVLKLMEKLSQLTNTTQQSYGFVNVPPPENKEQNPIDKEAIADLIANNKSEKAMEFLLAQNLEEETLNAVRLNSSKLIEINNKSHLGLLSNEEYNLQKVRINNSLLQILKTFN